MKLAHLTTTELVDRLKEILGVKSDGEVADSLSISRASLSMKKARNSSILNEVLCLAQRKNIDLNRLLLGIESTHKGTSDIVTLRDEKGNDVHEIHPGRKFLESRNLAPDALIVIRQDNGNLHLVDTSVQKITNAGIYAIATENGILLKRATIRLDGSVLFPSQTPGIPPEQIQKSEVVNLQIIGRSALMLAPPE
ncbi:hypothetical protein A2G06_16530 (plasmid) [Geobacter anodireducens]|nr:hypothetical protein A2G06_16530 [Geobacter anodireducens]